jgi:hypothetical protein
MAKKDVEAIINHFKQNEPGLFTMKCSRSKAYTLKRQIDLKLNPFDRFCEVKYDKETQTARFDIVS